MEFLVSYEISRGFATQRARQGRDEEKGEEDEEENLRDSRSGSGDACEAENSGDEGEDEKGE